MFAVGLISGLTIGVMVTSLYHREKVRACMLQSSLQKELLYNTSHDYMTKIYNRAYFEQEVSKYNEDIDVPVGMILCDLDELKYINDQVGHEAGDELIKSAAQFLNQYSNEHIIVSRIGGDEFTILMINIEESNVIQLMKQIDYELMKYNLEDNTLTLKISKGYAYTDSSLGNMRQLRITADKAMYQNKRLRKSNLATLFIRDREERKVSSR
ncbi:GGDEF domain-containing protein [Peribacillus asahii]|uniref:GGDEF domain-containing protein n=1 Tax=Peribacillus asahii TaxID=228899 RepID=A0A398B2C0_9BACI|nr:GGDEF domain-containing protein [Peribacillus asahii]RID84099.1 GGDEF domain-containing protein [Peribacillus asahii]